MKNNILETNRLIIYENNSNSNYIWNLYIKDLNEEIGIINYIDNYIDCSIYEDFRNNGYSYEALSEIIKYLFLEKNINIIKAKIDKNNNKGIFLAEYIGFNNNKSIFELDKKSFLKEYFRKDKLFITIDIDKDPYIKHISNDNILNITGSEITSVLEQYINNPNYIVINIDELYNNKYNKDNNNSNYEEFDKAYLSILDYYKNTDKYIILVSNNYYYLKDISLLKGDIIIIRTCINNCYTKNTYNCTFNELTEMYKKNNNIYNNYHLLNNFINRIDKL